MMYVERNMSAVVAEIAAEISEKTETSIKAQLNDLVSRGLLVVEYGPMTLVQSHEKNKIDYRQTVTLRLKDKEYIEELEAKLAKYEKILEIVGEK